MLHNMLERLEQKPRSAAVIGAGVVGMATAYALAQRGIMVTIIDRETSPAQGASFANGAQLSYCYTDALANPRLVKQMPRLTLGLDDAFRFHWNWDFEYWEWLFKFLANCTSEEFRKNTLAALELAQQSHKSMQRLLERHDLHFGHRVTGKMHLYSSPESFKVARKILEIKRGKCCDQQELSADEAKAVEPALEQLNGSLVGAIYTPDEAVGDAHDFSKQMLGLLDLEYGLTSYFGQSVEDIELTGNRAEIRLENGEVIESDMAVLCTGAQSAKLAKPLGIHLPVQPLKGYSFTASPGTNPPKTSITDSDRRIVISNLGNKIRVAGLADLGEKGTEVRISRMNALINSARASMPDAADYDAAGNFWAGLRPMTPNSLPIISCPHPSLAINTGHGSLGWTMAMGSADRLADLVVKD